MSTNSEIFLTNGQSYLLTVDVEEVTKTLTDTGGKLKEELQVFESSNGKKLFVNPQHVVLITDYPSADNMVVDTTEDEDSDWEEDRKEHNLQEAKKYQEEIDDMK